MRNLIDRIESQPLFYFFTLSSPHRPTLPLLQRAVSSAKKSLTARFGMGLGGTSSLLARR